MGRVTCEPLPGRRKDGPFLGDAFGRLQATAAARARCFKFLFFILLFLFICLFVYVLSLLLVFGVDSPTNPKG